MEYKLYLGIELRYYPTYKVTRFLKVPGKSSYDLALDMFYLSIPSYTV